MYLKWGTENDSIIFDSEKMLQEPVRIMKGDSEFKGDLQSCLNMLSEGDSAIFLIDADSLFKKSFKQPLPPFIKSGSKVKFYVRVLKTRTREELEIEQQNIAKQRETEEVSKIEAYVKENNLTVTTTASGLKYYITKPGTGDKPKTKNKVTVHYTGKLLNGKKFDSSVDRNQPFQFELGIGQVIKGWDEGIALLKKGEKATFIIPSNLGYGANGAGGTIGPFETLIFDVELIDFE
jgi:FKBP-type peptidyl-prolyl cis-trans isomerase FkpA